MLPPADIRLTMLEWLRKGALADLLSVFWVIVVIVLGSLYPPSETVAQSSVGPSSPASPVSMAVNVRMAPFNAKGDGRTDDTAAIQMAIDRAARVYLPSGIYRINPRSGLLLKTGTQLIGDGRASTLLIADAGGSTLRGLANYGPGSLLRRRFDPDGRNPYVSYVYLADFSLILSHPRESVTQDAIQIGIDLRNITRSNVERVHVGNVLPEGAAIRKASAHVHDSQGYGIVLGTVPSSVVSYAGGEMNSIRDTNVWGAYKAIVLDDATLSPRSAAHASLIERADLQGAQTLLSQESRYGHAFVWRDNVLQNVVPRSDGADQGVVMHAEGQKARIEGGYIEAGGLARYLLRLGSAANRVIVDLDFVSCTNTLLVIDEGQDNRFAMGGNCVTSTR